MITQKEAKKLFHYNDGKLYWKVSNSNRVRVGDEAGCVKKTDNYKIVRAGNVLYRVHRIIFLMFHGFLPKEIDHVDNDRLNNNIKNLRAATSRQNSQNSKISIANTSGIKGVGWFKRYKKWRARLMVNGKDVCVGYFKDIKDADPIEDCEEIIDYLFTLIKSFFLLKCNGLISVISS